MYLCMLKLSDWGTTWRLEQQIPAWKSVSEKACLYWNDWNEELELELIESMPLASLRSRPCKAREGLASMVIGL